MKPLRLFSRTALAAAFLASFGALQARSAEEGEISFTLIGTHSSNVLAVNEGTMQYNYDFAGLRGEGAEGVNAVAGVWCVGGLYFENGKTDNERGVCRHTYADGSTLFMAYTVTGGRGAYKGEWIINGATGTFEGASGSGTFDRSGAPAPNDRFGVSTNVYTGTYKLP